MDHTSMLSEVLGHLAYAFNETQPYIPMYTHLILSALFPIFTGAHASLTRPSSAAKPPKRKKKKADDDEDEEDEESMVQKMEGLSPGDALVFPIVAGVMLTSLYFVIKWIGPQLLNKILGWYFASIAVFGVAKLLNDGSSVVESFIWPKYYIDDSELWEVKGAEKKVVGVGRSTDTIKGNGDRSSPLPGVFGRIPLPPVVLKAIWDIRNLAGQKYLVRAFVHPLPSIKGRVTLRSVLSSFVALAAVLFSNIYFTPWWLTNIQGFAFSYSALQLMSPTTFGTGSLILIGLFFYDIYFVFYTPVMISVASNLDIPIKLLFPRPAEEGQDPAVRRLAMLGLGDIVLPGIVIGLALRFDLYMYYLKKQTKKSKTTTQQTETEAEKAMEDDVVKQPYKSVTGLWGDKFWTTPWTPGSRISAKDNSTPAISSFPKPYFHATVTGYIVGMCVTLGVMQVYQHGQPALLYLVPGVLGSAWTTALIRGELKQMWEFSEAIEEDPTDETDEKKQDKDTSEDDKTDSKSKDAKAESSWSSWLSDLFNVKGKNESEARLRDEAASLIDKDEEDCRSGKVSKASLSKNTGKENSTDANAKKSSPRDPPNEIIFFSVTRVQPSSAAKNDTSAKNPESTSRREGGRITRSASRKSTTAIAASDSSDDAVVISNADIDEDDADEKKSQPRWRGSKGAEDLAGGRAGKRLRML